MTALDALTIEAGPADRFNKQKVTAHLNGTALHIDKFDVASAFHRAQFAEAVVLKATGEPPADGSDLSWIGNLVLKAAGKTSNNGKPQRRTNGDTAPAAEFSLTDSGNAERFARQHSNKARFCFPWNRWLIWDGRRWAPDETGESQRLAKETIRAIYHDASSETDDDYRRDLVRHARACESATRRDALLKLARCEEPLPILPDKLDTDPWLLNCQNGTLDLKTGTLHAHSQNDFITKLCRVEYHPDATAPTWLSFLNRIFDGNDSLIEWLQRFCGYCLSGDVSEQILAIFYGTGSNGKSTLVNVLLELLGSDYASKAASDLLLVKRDAHPTERADLFGRRFVACVEADEGRRLAEALVKDLTGGDRLRARRLYENHFEFSPTHKIILATNHRPAITGTDHAIWRRIRLVSFNVTIVDDEQDHRLPDKLRAELPGILNWCVQGCLNWQQHGLGQTDEIRQATSAYQSEQDTLAAFFEEHCLLGLNYRVRAGQLYESYRKWAETTGEQSQTQRRFGQAIQERGFQRDISNGKWYRGIALIAE